MTVTALVEKKVDVDSQADDGSTPLHRACAWGNSAVVDVLLGAGASRQIKNKAGMVAMQEIGMGRDVGTDAKEAIVKSFHSNFVPASKA